MIKLKDILNKILPKSSTLLTENKAARQYNKCVNKCNKKHEPGSTGHDDCHDACDGMMNPGSGGSGLLQRSPRTTRRQRSVQRINYRG